MTADGMRRGNFNPDPGQLFALGCSALIELDCVAVTKTSSKFTSFTSFQSVLMRSNAPCITGALTELLRMLRPFMMHRAGLKLLEVLIQIHQLHR